MDEISNKTLAMVLDLSIIPVMDFPTVGVIPNFLLPIYRTYKRLS